MAKIKDVTLSFPSSPSDDVVGYKLYIEESPTGVTHDSTFYDLGVNTTIVLNDIMDDRICHTLSELIEEYPQYADVEEFPVIYEGSFSNEDEAVEGLLCDSDIDYRDENMIIRKEGGF